MSKLPNGWIKAELSDVLLEILGGGTPSKANAEYFNGDIPFMTVKDMKTNYPEDTQDKITSEALHNSSAKLIPADTLIISTRMGLGKIVRAPFDTAINQDLKALFVNDDISKDFLFYWYKSNAQLIKNLGKGTTVKGIRLEVLRTLKLMLPPLNEQKRIAEKLDKVFEEIDSIRTRLDKIPDIIKCFRQSIMRSATNGTLVFKKAENTHSEYALYNVPTDWTWQPFEKVATIRSNLVKPKNYSNYPHIAPNHIESGTGKLLPYTTVAEDGVISAKHLFRSGQIIYSKIRPYLAKATLVEFDGLCSADMYPIDVDIDTNYMLLWMLSDAFTSQAIQQQGRTVLPKINQKELNEFLVPVPPINDQKIIARKAQELLILADRIEEKYNYALSEINSIAQSVLNRACSGELVPQDPNDEPASVIMGKIKEEKKRQTLNYTKETGIVKKNKEVRKMSSSVLFTLQQEQKPLTAQSLLEKSGYPRDADSEAIERFFLDISKCLIEGTIVRERVQDEDVFKLVA